MEPISQMIFKLFVAIILGAVIGLERESAGKDAGIRTCLLVSAGSCVFSIIALSLPYLVAASASLSPSHVLDGTGFLQIIANIVVGIGFLGAGIIIKTESHVHGLTTAAAIWTAAAIGTLTGVGMLTFAVAATVIIFGTLYLTRKLEILRGIRHE